MSTKRDKLELAVIAALADASHYIMEWGKDDCALWCANIVRDALGYDPAAPYRGKYKTRRGSLRALGRKGLKGALQGAARRHKWKRINPVLAQPGDLGLTWTRLTPGAMRPTPALAALAPTSPPTPPVLATVICRANGWFVGRNEKGYTAIPACDVAVAWSVLNDSRLSEVGPRTSAMRPYRPAAAPEYAAPQDPISDAIGLSALIASVYGGLAVGGVASAIGGFFIASGVSADFSTTPGVNP